MEGIQNGLLFSTIAGISTLFGAFIVILVGRPNRKLLAGLLGLAAGIMLAISTFELLLQGLNISSLTYCLTGFLAGTALLFFINFIIFPGKTIESKNGNNMLKIGYLILLGIALHNFPEGLAIGAGVEASPDLGLLVAVSIGIHNIPEGMATTAPLKAGGLGNTRIIFFTLLAGLMAPLGTITGKAIFTISPAIIGMGLTFASGAMLYIVFDELIPEGNRLHPSYSKGGIMLGFIIGFIIST